MMRLKNTFQLIGIVTTVFLFANFISWLIWGLDEVPELTANCITDCVFSTPDSVFILNFENSDLKVLEGSIISFNDKEREELMNTLNILFFNRPQKYINKDKIQIYGYGIKTPVFYAKFYRFIPFYLSIDSGVYYGSATLNRAWKGIWIFGWLIHTDRVTSSA